MLVLDFSLLDFLLFWQYLWLSFNSLFFIFWKIELPMLKSCSHFRFIFELAVTNLQLSPLQEWKSRYKVFSWRIIYLYGEDLNLSWNLFYFVIFVKFAPLFFKIILSLLSYYHTNFWNCFLIDCLQFSLIF